MALVTGGVLEKLVVIIFTAVAIFLIGSIFEGYLINNKLNLISRLLLGACALILIIPNPNLIHFELFVLKIITLFLVLLWTLIPIIISKKIVMKNEKT